MFVQEMESFGNTSKMTLKRLKFLCVNYNPPDRKDTWASKGLGFNRDNLWKGVWLAIANGLVSSFNQRIAMKTYPFGNRYTARQNWKYLLWPLLSNVASTICYVAWQKDCSVTKFTNCLASNWGENPVLSILAQRPLKTEKEGKRC